MHWWNLTSRVIRSITMQLDSLNSGERGLLIGKVSNVWSMKTQFRHLKAEEDFKWSQELLMLTLAIMCSVWAPLLCTLEVWMHMNKYVFCLQKRNHLIKAIHKLTCNKLPCAIGKLILFDGCVYLTLSVWVSWLFQETHWWNGPSPLLYK